MKTLVRIINIHDGQEKEYYNGRRLYIESRPRTEEIMAAFLNDGWNLEGSAKRYNPSISRQGTYSFFLGGWEMIFTKVVEDDAEDDSDELLSDILYKLECIGNDDMSNNACDEEDEDDNYDYYDEEDEDDDDEYEYDDDENEGDDSEHEEDDDYIEEEDNEEADDADGNDNN